MKIKKGDWVTFANGGKAQVEDVEHACVQFKGFSSLVCYPSNLEHKIDLLTITGVNNAE